MAVNNITNVATQQQTEEEKLRKQNTQLPYVQATNQTQPVTLTPNAGQTQPQQQQVPLNQMAQQVPQVPQNQALQTATQVSTQQATQPSAMQQLINQKATDLMQNPTMGFDQQAYKQGQLSSYDLQNAQMYEALRQKNAGIANSGIWQSESLQNQVDALRNRGELERKIDYENRDFNIESAINAMTQGLKAEGQSQSTIDNAVKNLVATYSAQTPERTALIGAQSAQNLQASEQDFKAQQAELDRRAAIALQSGDIAGQKEIEALKADLTLKQLTAQQNWQGAQNELDRRAQIALQAGDIAGQKEIEALKADLTLKQLTAQQNWQGVQNELNRRNELALQSNDINAVRNNLLTQINADKEAQASGQQFTAEQNAMNRLLETSLKTMDIDSARSLVELKGKIDSGMLLQEQDWQGAQNELNRLHDLAVQQGDIKGQKEIEAIRGEIAAAAQKSQQDWQTAERVSSQIYNTSERIDQNSADLAMKKYELDNQKSMQMQDFYNNLDLRAADFRYEDALLQASSDLEEAKAKNDYVRTEALTKLQSALESGRQDDAQLAAKELAELEANTQKYLQSENAALQLKMQTQGFTQEEKMQWLQSQYDEVKANGDVQRQKDIIKFQTGEKLAEMAAQNGYDTAMETLKGDINTALQNNDFVHAEALQEARLKLEVEKLAQDKFFQQASLDLQSRGVNMQEVEQQYAQIQSLVDQNILPESALMEFATSTLQKNGVDTSSYQMVDKQKAAEQALQQEYELQKKQFMQTHPEYMQPNYIIAGQELTMKQLKELNPSYTDDYIRSNFQATEPKVQPDVAAAMNEYINSALYGEETTAQKEAKKTAGYLVNNAANTANVGDSLNITEATKTTSGSTLPVGIYDVISNASSKKDLWRKRTDNVIIAKNRETGQEYEIRTDKGGESKTTGSKLLDPLGIFG